MNNLHCARAILSVTARLAVVIISLTASQLAQSTTQEFPTAVTETEISGTIPPRDIGDARLTSYFYNFEASNGDLFINILARNFNGDIDLFTVSGLRPLTKVIVYADREGTETGRIVYFRKPEKLLLRIQGRAPGDEPATFRIKFAGSFVAVAESEQLDLLALPKIAADGPVRVNAVGTIIERPSRRSRSEQTTERPAETAESSRVLQNEPAKPAEEQADRTSDPNPRGAKKVEVIVTESAAGKASDDAGATRRRRAGSQRVPERSSDVAAVRRKRPPSSSDKNREPDPLEKVNLVVLLKDGTRIDHPMTEVLRFSVDRGRLTIVTKDGSVTRHSLLDVAKVSIE